MISRLIIGISGASGVYYAKRFLEIILDMPVTVSLIITKTAALVIEKELDVAGFQQTLRLADFLSVGGEALAKITSHSNDDLLAPPASGSIIYDAMVIIPCSMKTLSAVASGLAADLLTRAADVCLKERRPLILVPRETPLNAIHLENMLTLANAGACVLPAMPAFYHHPRTIDDLADFLVARIFAHLGLPHPKKIQWTPEDPAS
jgi:4-hydroxy-3-polyprenylbenzoate decarboxylase